MARLPLSLPLAFLFLSHVDAQPALDFRVIGRFTFPMLAGTTYSYAFGDVDGDRRVDVYVSKGRGTDQLLIACPGGGYVISQNDLPKIGGKSYQAQIVDVNADGHADIVLAGENEYGTGNAIFINTNMVVGRFQDQTAQRMPQGSNGRVLAVGDVNGDRSPDLFFGGYDQQPSHLYLNDGTGNFTAAPSRLPPIAGWVTGVAMFDADRDGDQDLVVAQAFAASIYLRNDGGTFVRPAVCFPDDVLPSSGVAVGDVDGDQELDVVLSGYATGTLPRQSRLMRNRGGCFVPEPLPQIDEDATGVALADLDGDGDLDLAFSCYEELLKPSAPVILLNDGFGGFSPSGWQTQRIPARTIAAEDVDDDGDTDLWIGGDQFGNAFDVWYANFERQIEAPFNPRLGAPYRLVISARRAQSVPGTAHLFLGFDFLQPRFELPPFGRLGVHPAGMVLIADIPLDANGEAVVMTPFGNIPMIAAQALIVLNRDPMSARFTNVWGDWL